MKSNSLSCFFMKRDFFHKFKFFSNTKLHRFSQKFCYSNLIILGFTFSSVSHFRLDLYMIQGVAQGCSPSPPLFLILLFFFVVKTSGGCNTIVEQILFLPLNYLCTFTKNHVSVYVSLFLDSLFSLIVLFIYFLPISNLIA